MKKFFENAIKRFGLLIVVNAGVMTLLYGIYRALDAYTPFGPLIDQYVAESAWPLWLGMAAVFGFLGSFLSLGISRWVAIRNYGVFLHHSIAQDPVVSQARKDQADWLKQVTERLAAEAGLKKAPMVGIYFSDDVNAFATGPTRNRSLIAVSTGLFDQFEPDDAEAVVAHEVSHIANGDMVTMALLMGVMNTFVFFFAHMVAKVISRLFGQLGIVFELALIFLLQIVFGFLASIVVSAYSRAREYRADAGAADLVGKAKVLAMLDKLNMTTGNESLDHSQATMGIVGRQFIWSDIKTLFGLLSTHPPLLKRIRAIENKAA